MARSLAAVTFDPRVVPLLGLIWLIASDFLGGRIRKGLAGLTYFRPKKADNARLVIAGRIASALMYGFVPVMLLRLSGRETASLGLGLRGLAPTLTLGLAGAALLCPLVYANRGTAENLARYPEIRAEAWTPGLRIRSAWSWAGYLLAYESFFRGIFLFSAAAAFGTPAAVAVNLAAYAFVHRRKGWRETLGAVPFGALLCLVALETGSILAGWLIHVGLAWSNEWFSLAAHREVRFARGRGGRP